MDMPSLDAIGIVAADVAASANFYRLLGLEIPESNEDHLEATTATGLRVMLDSVELAKQLDPDWVQPAGKPIALAFLCSSPGEVDDVYERVVVAGYRAKNPPYDAFWGQRYATVLDPDGNAVDLFAPLANAAT
jgi:uncharacterized glyoxalase superfamily protein PhnB